MLVSGIKSKPVYAPLRLDARGRYHLMLGVGSGGTALLRVLAEMRADAPGALQHTRVFFGPTDAADPIAAAQPVREFEGMGLAEVRGFEHLGLAEVRSFAGATALLADFKAVLEGSLMGTRLYVAGPESFIGLAMQIALEFNLNQDEIRAEEWGSQARRVYCIHCRAANEAVRTNIVRCRGCARWLLVRDHYSRRLAAYMGVMADAEVPGELPELREVYL